MAHTGVLLGEAFFPDQKSAMAVEIYQMSAGGGAGCGGHPEADGKSEKLFSQEQVSAVFEPICYLL